MSLMTSLHCSSSGESVLFLAWITNVSKCSITCGNTLSTHLYFYLYFNLMILGYLTVLLLSAFILCILV